jgi:hypothetical protein
MTRVEKSRAVCCTRVCVSVRARSIGILSRA